MKILIVSQYYWPEPFRITDLAESLVLFGHEVTVLTGLPNYPEGRIYDGYQNKSKMREEHNGVNIIRTKIKPRKNNIFSRFLNYYSFQLNAEKAITRLDKDFDVVLVNGTSPIMSYVPGLKYAKKHGIKTLLYEMDLWPESLLAGGITRKSFIYRYYKRLSANIYSQFDRILVSTEEHIGYIKNLKHCKNLSIKYLPQYADSVFEHSNCNWKNNKVIDLMFAGNVGKAQSIETIIEAASLLKNKPTCLFHIVGSGSELEKMKRLSNKLGAQNVVFYGQKSLNEMPELYEIADAMLVTLENKPYANMTIPGKVQSYMAVGKPIVGAVNGSCANFINNARIGYVCSSEDSKALADLIEDLDFNELKKIGDHARKVYLQNYKKSLFIAELVKHLNALID